MSDIQQTNKNLHFISISGLFIGITIFLLHFYYSNYNIFYDLDITVGLLDTFLANTTFFKQSLTPRLFTLLFLATGILYPYQRKKTKKFSLILFLLSSSIFLLCDCFVYMGANYFIQILNLIISFVSMSLVYTMFLRASNLLFGNTDISENAIEADGFEQNTEFLENEYSFNFKTEYSHKNKKIDGYVNVINPQRGVIVIGSPGSGKSYSIIEEIIRQGLEKNYCLINYDFKDPTLSELVYEYYLCEKNRDKNYKHRFSYLSFKDMQRTYRCNPLKGIKTSGEAAEFSTIIQSSLNKSANNKEDFFTMSGKQLTTLCIFFLSKFNKGNYLSIPHLITLLCTPSTELFDRLEMFALFESEARALFAPFKQAVNDGAAQQLAGQIATAQITIGSIVDKELFYLMTESKDANQNINLDINDPNNPTVFTIGNDPDKQKFCSLAISCVFARVNKYINRKGKHKILYCVDEFPTIHLDGISNLISTGRANKIATVLALQDFSQLEKEYGKDYARSVINIMGSRFAGQVSGDTAKTLSQAFGKHKVKKYSQSISENGISTTISEQQEDRITEDTISSLSQGNFVGQVADNFGEEISRKFFSGKFIVPPKIKMKNKIPILRDEFQKEISDNHAQIMQDIRVVLSSFTQMIKIVSIVKTIGDEKKWIAANKSIKPSVLSYNFLNSVFKSNEELISSKTLLTYIKLIWEICDEYGKYFEISSRKEILMNIVYETFTDGSIENKELILNFVESNNLYSKKKIDHLLNKSI